MHAAVVTAFERPPRYTEWPEPAPAPDGHAVVEVVAAALHPRVRSQADGSHYTSSGELPLIPGIDAVVRDAEGGLHYALLDDTAAGTLAERTVIDVRRSIPLPAGTDAVAVAAAMNPVMSSWVALKRRVAFAPGSRVLVLGATGSAGGMALHVAQQFGAAEVIAAARPGDRLDALLDHGADRVLALDDLALAAEVDVVLDYVWGAPSERGIVDIVTARADRSRPLTWIEIGSVAGPDLRLPSAALRAARLDLVGSGVGSVSGAEFRAELPQIAAAVSAGEFEIDTQTVPLADVEAAWASETRRRLVFTP